MSYHNVVESSPARNPLLTRNFIALVITQICFGLSFSCFFLLPMFMRSTLHATDLEIGSVAALGSLTGVLAFPLVGSLNDRLGRKAFVVLGCLLMIVGALAMLWVRETGPLLYGLRVVHGLAFALVFNSATTLVSDAAPAERLDSALAVFGSSLLITHALAPAAAELLSQRYGWPSVFWFSALLALLAVLAALRVAEEVQRGDTAGGGLGVGPLLRRARTWRVVLTIAAAGASFGSVFTFHQPYALSLGITRVSGFFVAYASCALIARLWLMGLLREVKRQQLSAYAMVIYAAAVLCTVWLRPGVLETVGAIMGVAQGVFYPVFNALAIEGVEPKQRGSMMSLYHGGFNGGIAVALLSGGAVAERFGYPSLFAVSALVTAAAAVWLWLGGE
jgi:predicted MFS family arabinose efflux permease